MVVNNALEIPFPEGFLEMSREETAGLQTVEDGEFAALSNKEKHLLATVGWKQSGGLFARLLSSQELKTKMEHDIRKAMAQLDYQYTGSLNIAVGGTTADGFSYQYTAANGTEMSGDSFVLNRGNTLYYIHMYSRRALESENRGLVREIFASARWTD